MPRLVLFCEDSFHERFLEALVHRFAHEQGVAIRCSTRSSTGGFPKMAAELQRFLRRVKAGSESPPDALIVVADANCQGFSQRRRHFDDTVKTNYPGFENKVLYAIPDPHIERWMLVDEQAFRAVFGRGCTLPRVKCSKSEYKTLLRREIREAGIDAPLGGLEYADDIVKALRLNHCERNEPSLDHLLKALRSFCLEWKTEARR